MFGVTDICNVCTVCHAVTSDTQLPTVCHAVTSDTQLPAVCHAVTSDTQLPTVCHAVTSDTQLPTVCHAVTSDTQLTHCVSCSNIWHTTAHGDVTLTEANTSQANLAWPPAAGDGLVWSGSGGKYQASLSALLSLLASSSYPGQTKRKLITHQTEKIIADRQKKFFSLWVLYLKQRVAP